MSTIHYLRDMSQIKKRIVLFTDELCDACDPTTTDRNRNQADQLLLKILNELYTLKMSNIIRCKQHFCSLYSENDELAKTFFLRTVKERYFLKQIKSEIQKAGGHARFSPIIHSTSSEKEIYPSTNAEKILREHAAMHSLLIDCYLYLIDRFKGMAQGSSLMWTLKSMLAMEQKYARTEQRNLVDLAA